MNATQIINKKCSGDPLSDSELELVIHSYIESKIDDAQMTNFLKSVKKNGMSKNETISLTRIMIESGETIDFSQNKSFIADKHSTGGIGDKVSLVLGPIMACLGISVPMLAGRSLGHTGGTIDKLETIPNFNTNLPINEFKRNVEQSGLCIMAQTNSICPADKKIYALRDVTNTIDSVPLICGSIMSKKISEGIDGLVLDIKIGTGAFMKQLSDGKILGSMLKYVGDSFNVSTDIVFSNMDQPLGKTAGMWCEVLESINALKGDGADDLLKVSFELGSKLMLQAGLVETIDQAIEAQNSAISSGKAYEKFEEMVSNQYGQIEDAAKVNQPLFTKEIVSDKEGFLKSYDSTTIGWAAVEMGCGRKNKSDTLDNSAGIEFHHKIGDHVNRGDIIFRYYNSNEGKLEQAKKMLHRAFSISEKKAKSPKLIYTA